MKSTIRIALGALGFAALALSTMPAGNALAQSSDLKTAQCTAALRAECQQDVRQDADCCLHPELVSCAKRRAADEESDDGITVGGSGSGIGDDVRCLTEEAEELLGCTKCEFPEQVLGAPQ